MKTIIIAGAIALAFTTHSFSAENINLDDIVVTASRMPQAREAVIADVTVIENEEIQRAGTNSLVDLLRMQPGVQITSNGGAGAQSSVFLRGTNSDHVLVLIDGLRVSSATLGTTSLENIPLSQIERIEILRGPGSSLYGADAVGGVIQIFTRKADTNKLLAHAAVGLGTYDTKTAEAGISGAVGTLKYGINVSSLDTESFSVKRIRIGKDADKDSYRNLSVSAFTELELAPGHSWGLQFFESKGQNEFDNNYENFSEQTLQSYAFTSKNQFTDFWLSTFKLGMGVDDSDSHARPNTNPASSSYNPTGVSQYRTEQQQLTWQNDFSLPLGTLTLAYERLAQDVNSKSNVKARFKKERNDDSFLAIYVANLGKHAMQLSLRENHNSQYGNYTTGGAGYAYQISPQWRANVSYGNAFKAPTFNQLYFPDFGDPTLQPEKSDNIEAGIKYHDARFKAGVTLFENHVRNLIANVGQATSGCTFAGFCPVNVGKVEIQGVTADANWSVTDNLILSGNFTVQSPRDATNNNLLPRRGNRYGTISLLHKVNDFQWGAEITGASVRYNDLNNQFKLGGYALLNFTANYQINPEWRLQARANNVLDKQYVLSTTKSSFSPSGPDYNTAGSNLFIGLRFDMKP